MRTVVILGANVAGARCADTLRQAGYDGRIALVGAERDLPYERPPLSKEYLRGAMTEERTALHPPAYYAEHSIELYLGRRATALNPRQKEVTLDDRDALRYDALLIATGTVPHRLDTTPGADLKGIFYLRDLADSRALRTALENKPRVTIVGTGFIGAEVAASCRSLGLDVVALEAAPVPLARALGAEIGQHYAEIHRQHGVDLRTGTSVTGFEGHKRVERVITSTGESIPSDVV